MVEVASKVCPKGAKEVPRRTRMSSQHCPKSSTGPLKYRLACPRVPKDSPRRGRGRPSGAQESPKDAHSAHIFRVHIYHFVVLAGFGCKESFVEGGLYVVYVIN